MIAQRRATGRARVMLSLRFLDASIWPSLTDALLDRVEKPIVNKIKRINNEIELMASVTHGGISSMEFYQIPDINIIE
jgi:hypothetical protein